MDAGRAARWNPDVGVGHAGGAHPSLLGLDSPGRRPEAAIAAPSPGPSNGAHLPGNPRATSSAFGQLPGWESSRICVPGNLEGEKGSPLGLRPPPRPIAGAASCPRRPFPGPWRGQDAPGGPARSGRVRGGRKPAATSRRKACRRPGGGGQIWCEDVVEWSMCIRLGGVVAA